MLNSYVSAKLFDDNIIKVMIFSTIEKKENEPINLIINSEKFEKLTIIKQTFLNGISIYECKPKEEIKLGNSYYIAINNFGITALNVNDATSFSDFDTKYYYDKNDLGCSYSKEETTFKVWAPLASKVVLFIRKNNEANFSTYVMNRNPQGVYEITLPGDYETFLYRYKITNSGLSFLTTDPYAKASTANGKDSVVVDLSKCQIDLHLDKLPQLKSYSSAIIYELDVRDFTIDKNTNIVNKGKYLGLTESGTKTSGNNPAGLDYLEFLGVTHVQVLPIYDFETVDELRTNETYNWGYDPQQYFVPEGGYSTDPNDPYARIIETKKMVGALHNKGIKVNMDVVFNHVYNYQTSVFEKVVPNYYFRKQKNGALSNDSYCGNDLDSKRPMVRKLIADSLSFWMDEYGIDGFRFDLLGLMDINTLNYITNMIKTKRSDAMIYGEGWNMANALPFEERSTILNSFKTPTVAFFNDSFRDVVGGPNSKNELGYLGGNCSYLEGFKYSIMGSCVNYCYPPRFVSYQQSINYCECHDNQTLFDKLNTVIKNENRTLRCVRTINFGIIFSLGISFFHAGQEIGLTKFGEDNTYNKGDKYNKFDYSILDKRFDMARYLSSLIHFKKQNIDSFTIDLNDILNNVKFTNMPNGSLMMKLNNLSDRLKNVIVVYNPTGEIVNVKLDDYYIAVVTFAGAIKNSDLISKDITLNPYEVNLLIKKEE